MLLPLIQANKSVFLYFSRWFTTICALNGMNSSGCQFVIMPKNWCFESKTRTNWELTRLEKSLSPWRSCCGSPNWRYAVRKPSWSRMPHMAHRFENSIWPCHWQSSCSTVKTCGPPFGGGGKIGSPDKKLNCLEDICAHALWFCVTSWKFSTVFIFTFLEMYFLLLLAKNWESKKAHFFIVVVINIWCSTSTYYTM